MTWEQYFYFISYLLKALVFHPYIHVNPIVITISLQSIAIQISYVYKT